MWNGHRQLFLFLIVLCGLASGTTQAAQDGADDEARDKAVAERFRKVLEGNPRRGTALDRFYGYHVERGSLDALVAEYQKRTTSDPKDGVSWMIMGLIESQRGKDTLAVTAFREAEKHFKTSALPGYYLGQSLVLIGQPDGAADAFERALERNPARADLLDIFQALGRVHQRAQRAEKALAVWVRLEKLFPDDALVQEQIVSTLVEEGQFEQALPRLEKLAKTTQDRYRQSTLLMEAAELKVRLKNTPQALKDFEALLDQLNPDNWLHRDVRRRIEDVFLRTDDLTGLAKYYEDWMAKHPSDLEAIARLAKTLSTQGRLPEARSWLRKGIEVAPAKKELRQSLIEQLVYEQKHAEAAQEYEALDKIAPGNPDTLREWGKLFLKDTAKPEPERKAAAAAIWKRILERQPKDAGATARVADLVRTAGLTDEALALYRKAIDLSPTSAQYREYLGEYLHTLKRSDEALAAWRPIAEGANRNAKNLARLAEVFSGFGYRKEAIVTLAEAIKLEKDDFNFLLTYADMLHQDERHDDALAQLDAALKLASNNDEGEQVLQAQIKIYQTTESLTTRAEQLQKELDDGQNPTADRWHKLARYYEAGRQMPEATVAILKAVDKDAKSVHLMTAAARIQESSGNLLAAADMYRKLAAIDRRFRTEYLTSIAKLEQRLGRRQQALQAGRDLLAAAPGNPEHYKFFAELCFQLGDAEEGLESLRRSVRANPSDPDGLLVLAQALSERTRTNEAIELLWRAFDKSNALEGKLGVIERLTSLYLQNNQFDRLLERLERERREAEKAREMTLCIAQAYQRAGDLGTARQQLERLLTENSRDSNLLQQLSQLAEGENDTATATKYQRQLAAVATGNRDAQLRLAQLLVKNGEHEEAAEIWVKLIANEPEAHRNLQAIDQLASNEKHDALLSITNRLLAQRPNDWELLFRQATTLATLNKIEEAERQFRAILALKIADDEDGAALKAQKKKQKGAALTQANMGRYEVPIMQRMQSVYELRSIVGLESGERYYGPGGGPVRRPAWTPQDYGQARLGALTWLYSFAVKNQQGDAFLKTYKTAKEQPKADTRTLWDWYYLQLARSNYREMLDAGRALSTAGDPAGAYIFLNGLATRGQSSDRYSRSRGGDSLPPLPDDQLEQMLTTFKRLQTVQPRWAALVTNNILAELKRAKRTDEARKIYDAALASPGTIQAVELALELAAPRGDMDAVLSLFDKLDKMQGPASPGTGNFYSRQSYPRLGLVMAIRADEKKYGDVNRILDSYIAHIRRQNQAATNKTTTSRRAQQYYPRGEAVIFSASPNNRGSRGVAFDYPAPNDYFDYGAIVLLRNAHEFHKRADLMSDLFAHCRSKAGVGPPGERVYYQLALAYLHWWNDEKEEALNQLTAAVKEVPGDLTLVMDAAEMYEKDNQHDVALTLLDSISPLDQNMMLRREQFALRLAERTGNVDRARNAAERLFGLRLDAQTQVDLGGKMHRLGMHELAESVLSRAQRQSGNQTNALLTLMNQYQTQNQQDQALQVARQLLRRGPSLQFQAYRGYDEGDNGRQQAIRVLARSGKLNEMVERAEAQLKASPRSPQAHQTLLDFYLAANDKEKFKATAIKMAELKPDDGRVRWQIAQQLQNMGEKSAAIEQYLLAIKLEPAAMANRYYEISRFFQEMKKTDELIAVIMAMDLRKMGSSFYSFGQLMQQLVSDEKTRPQGLALFRKAWEAFPAERSQMLGQFYNDDFWRMPEIYDYARQALIPPDDGVVDPWRGAEQIYGWGTDGRVKSFVGRTLEIARRQNKIGALRGEIERAAEKHPEWRAGAAILAIIDLQNGKPEVARNVWQGLFDDKKAPITGAARCVLTQELDHFSDLEDLVIKMLEQGATDILDDVGYDFALSPLRRLITIHEDAGRMEEIRQFTLKNFGTPERIAMQSVNDMISMADEMLRLSFPVEAIQFYNELLADRVKLANQGGQGYEQRAELGLKRAIEAVKPETMQVAVRGMLTPRPSGAAGNSVLDLVLVIDSRDLRQASLKSLFESIARGAAKDAALNKEMRVKLTELAGTYPNDVSVLTATAMMALVDGQPDAAAHVQRLLKLLEASPLEELPAKTRANSRQRAQALQQLVVWMVARECLSKTELRADGERLAERALVAAARQATNVYSMAILRELGKFEMERGNAKAAQGRWSKMIELALPPPAQKKTPAAKDATGAQSRIELAPMPLPVHDAFRSLSPGTPGERVGVRGLIAPSSGDNPFAAQSSSDTVFEGFAPPPPLVGVEAGFVTSERLTPGLKAPTPLAGVEPGFVTSERLTPGLMAPTPLAGVESGFVANRLRGSRTFAPPRQAGWGRGDPIMPILVANPGSTPASGVGAEPADKDCAELYCLSSGGEASRVAERFPKESFVTHEAVHDETDESVQVAQAKSPPPLSSPKTKVASPSNIAVVTVDQFIQAHAIARLTLENKSPLQSLQVMREAFRGGPPLATPGAERGMKRMYSASGEIVEYDSNSVETKLLEMVALWRKERVAESDIYDVLVAAALPDVRPAEVFLYLPQYFQPDGPKSVARVLAQSAVRANRVDDLRRRARARAEQILGELPAKILLGYIAVEAADRPAIEESFRVLSERLRKDTLQNTAESIANMAVATLEKKDLAPLAIPLLDQAAKNLSINSRWDSAINMLYRIARHHVDAGAEPAARAAYREIEELAKKTPARGPGVAGQQQAGRLVNEYIHAGWPLDALSELGKIWDAQDTASSGKAGGLVLGSLVNLTPQLLGLPAAQRYEALKAWTMPTDARRALRLALAAAPVETPPQAFGKYPRSEGPLNSTALLLIDAARESGKLDELAKMLAQHAKDKVENAEAVFLLTDIARGQGVARKTELVARLADMKKPTAATSEQKQPIGKGKKAALGPVPPPVIAPTASPTAASSSTGDSFQWTDILIAEACLRDRDLADLGEEMMKTALGHADRKSETMGLTQGLRHALARRQMKRAGFDFSLRNSGLLHWNVPTRATWIGHDNHVAQIAADLPGALLFECPLTGTFEFSLDAHIGGALHKQIGYAGLVFELTDSPPSGGVTSVGGNDRVPARAADFARIGDFNRLTVQVEPGKIRCLVNGELFYEDTDPAPTSPWIVLGATGMRSATFRNFVITGNPSVPREVSLSQRDHLAGWSPLHSAGRLPTPLTDREPKTLAIDDERPYYYARQVESTEPVVYDWQAKDGDILGRKLDEPQREPVSSKLAYFRAVKSGEKVRYEFFHQPGEFHVHPSLGRLVFLLEEGGVKLHWATESKDDWTRLATDNSVAVPQVPSGSTKLPLKPNDWNTVQLALDNRLLAIELNGVKILQRAMEDDNDLHFGLFHYRDRTAVKVRNVVLQGNWPDHLEKTARAGFATAPIGSAVARVHRESIGEALFAKSAGVVLQATKDLSADERYRALTKWVLPADERLTFQLAGEWTARDLAAPALSAEKLQGRRVHLGATFTSPALELVKAAKETGRLDELADAVKRPTSTEYEERCQLALLAIVLANQKRDAEAEKHLRQLEELVKKLPLEVELHFRWPEYLAASSMIDRPALHAAAVAIFDVMLQAPGDFTRKKKDGENREDWITMARHARAGLLTSDRATIDINPNAPLGPWFPAVGLTAALRSKPHTAPIWSDKDNVIWHRPGHSTDSLYLQTPLTGDFEFTCEFTPFMSAGPSFSYGGLTATLEDSRKSASLFANQKLLRKLPLDPVLAPEKSWYRYRLAVQRGKATITVNDRELFQEDLGFAFDPWLIIQVNKNTTAQFRNLRLKGEPVVLQTLDLTSGFDLNGWRNYYTIGDWQKRGEEIRSALLKQSLIGKAPPERAFHYHRPLVEDGEVDYEFYYVPARTAAHPLLDRTAFLLEPSGVRLHWLTDGKHDPSGLKFDNVFDEPANRRGPSPLPLKANAWNQAKMTIKGDTVHIAVNGEEVYQRPIEPTNQRIFGYFHHADKTEARIRNVVYRGAWPGQVPLATAFSSGGKQEK